MTCFTSLHLTAVIWLTDGRWRHATWSEDTSAILDPGTRRTRDRNDNASPSATHRHTIATPCDTFICHYFLRQARLEKRSCGMIEIRFSWRICHASTFIRQHETFVQAPAWSVPDRVSNLADCINQHFSPTWCTAYAKLLGKTEWCNRLSRLNRTEYYQIGNTTQHNTTQQQQQAARFSLCTKQTQHVKK